MNTAVFSVPSEDLRSEKMTPEAIFEVIFSTNDLISKSLENQHGSYKNLRYGLLRKLSFFVEIDILDVSEAYAIAQRENSYILDVIGTTSSQARANGNSEIGTYPLW